MKDTSWAGTYKPTKIKEFLLESNAIEQVYSKEALKDALDAWNFGWANRDKINVDYVLSLHGFLMHRNNPRIAGKVRDCGVWIGGVLKMQEPAPILKSRINDWCKKTNKEIASKKFKAMGNEQRSRCVKNWHIDFEEIHPFEDGNGRTGRILMNIQMYLAELPLLIIHEGDEQMQYYDWFFERKRDEFLMKILNEKI